MDRRRRCDGWRSRRWRCDTWRDGRCDGFTLEFDFANAADPSLDRTAVLVLDPATNTIAAHTLTTGATTAGLDLLLPAGGGVLLRYKNGRPFARQP